MSKNRRSTNNAGLAVWQKCTYRIASDLLIAERVCERRTVIMSVVLYFRFSSSGYITGIDWGFVQKPC